MLIVNPQTKNTNNVLCLTYLYLFCTTKFVLPTEQIKISCLEGVNGRNHPIRVYVPRSGADLDSDWPKLSAPITRETWSIPMVLAVQLSEETVNCLFPLMRACSFLIRSKNEAGQSTSKQ